MRDRLNSIDSLRGLAALFIVVHQIYISVYGDALHLWQYSLTARCLTPFLYGRAGADLFLVISGFVLFYPVVSETRPLETYGRFMLRRAWRLLPPYYAVLALSLGMLALVPGLPNALPYSEHLDAHAVVTHVLLINNVGSPVDQYAINYPLWTVPLVFQLYAVFPLMVWLMLRLGALPTVAGAVMVTLAARWGIALAPDLSFSGFPLRALCNSVPGYLSVFAAGMAAAHLTVKDPPELSSRRWMAWTLALLLIGAGVLTWQTRGSYLLSDTSWGLGFACLVVAIVQAKMLQLPWLVGLGRISYSLFLVCAPLLACEMLLLAPFGLAPWQGVAVLLLIGVPLILAGAYGFHLAIERPFLRPPAWLQTRAQDDDTATHVA